MTKTANRKYRPCSEEGCDRAVKCRGLCPMHYGRLHRTLYKVNRAPRPPRRARVAAPGEASCSVRNCGMAIVSRDLCQKHYVKARKFRVSLDLLDAIHNKEVVCEGCGGTDLLSIDHDHACCSSKTQTCGECVRGVLCLNCNTTLGTAKDNVQVLRNLIEYLEKHRTASFTPPGL